MVRWRGGDGDAGFRCDMGGAVGRREGLDSIRRCINATLSLHSLSLCPSQLSSRRPSRSDDMI